MIPVKQKRVHEENVYQGDCWRSCIESVLEITQDSILPYWEIGEEFEDHYDKMMLAINNLGFAYHQILVKDLQINSLLSLDTYGYCLAIGISPRSTVQNVLKHCVVWKNGVAFDPHPSNEGILNIDKFGIFNKIWKEAYMKKENGKLAFYASIYSSWIEVAKKHGYALSIYGNFENNLTLIAVPWYNDAKEYKYLLESLCNNLDTTIWKNQYSFHTEEKPHNRILVTIRIMKNWYIHLNIVKPVYKLLYKSDLELLSDLLKYKILFIKSKGAILHVDRWNGLELECSYGVSNEISRYKLSANNENLSNVFCCNTIRIDTEKDKTKIYEKIKYLLDKNIKVYVDGVEKMYIKHVTLITYSLSPSQVSISIQAEKIPSTFLLQPESKVFYEEEIFPFKR